MTYAADTSVPVEKSKAELEGLLVKAGASQRAVVSDDEAGIVRILFTLGRGPDLRQVRLELPLPKRSAFHQATRLDGRPKSKSRTAESQWEQACRARWRAAVLLVRAKLEAVALGVSTLDREFFADMALPDGRTVYQAVGPSVAQAYLTGQKPRFQLTAGEIEEP